MQPATIVPANRLGQLLVEARHATGTDLEDLATKSNGLFTVGELADLEAGHRLLDDRLIEAATSLYDLGAGPIIPQRAELTIDLDRNVVSASGQAVPLTTGARDHVLDRYLSLVYLLRDREAGSPVPLRREDVDILAASLAERAELIEEQLLLAMSHDSEPVGKLTAWFRNRLWVPGAGALVGAVSVGTLVMVSDSTLPNPEPAAGSLPLTGDVNQPRPSPVLTPAPASAQTDVVQAATLVVTEVGDAAVVTVAPVAPVVAVPSTISTPSSTAAQRNAQEIGQQAEATLPFSWQATLPGWQVNYKGSNTSFRGLTFPYEKTIDIYVREGDSPELVGSVLAHELGHAVDVTYFSGGDRDDWLDARGEPTASWWPTAYASDFETGAGDFAEAFAMWAVQDQSSSLLSGRVTEEQMQLLESLIEPHIVER